MVFKAPVVKIAGVSVPRVILGNLPFMGESYQGSVRNQEFFKKFSKVDNTVAIIKKAVQKYGITVLSAMPTTEGGLAKLHLEAIDKIIVETGMEIALIPCFRISLMANGKPLNDYRRWLTYYEIEKQIAGEEILGRYLKDPILRCREGWEDRFLYVLKHSVHYINAIDRISIDRDGLGNAVDSLKGFNMVFIELGSETDFLVMIDRMDLLGELVDWLRGAFGYRVLLGSHHAGITIPTLEKSGIKFHGYVTPINNKGIMMFPTKELAVKGIRNSRKPIIAIKPLGGGRIRPQLALEYVFKELNAEACMIGVGSKDELDQDFTSALKLLRRCEKL